MGVRLKVCALEVSVEADGEETKLELTGLPCCSRSAVKKTTL